MKNKQNKELAVCGFAAVKKIEKNNPEKIRRLYFTQDNAPLFGGLCKKLAKRKGIYNQVNSTDELEKLSGTVHNQGVVAMIYMPAVEPLDFQTLEKWINDFEKIIILDHIENANNFGAIIRSAAFFGIKNIIVPQDGAKSVFTTSSYRIAEGGMEYVNIYSVKSIPNMLSRIKGKAVIIGTALDAKRHSGDIKSICGSRAAAVILGNEEKGIDKEIEKYCDELLIIPFAGMGKMRLPPVDSLNVAQAASIIFYELTKQY